MSRIVNILFALLLLAALVIVLDANTRRRAIDTIRDWEPALRQLDDRVIVNAPPLVGSDQTATPVPTATAVVSEDEQIPVTGAEDSSDEPIVTINWDALGDTLRKFWVRLSEVKIEFNPNPNNK